MFILSYFLNSSKQLKKTDKLKSLGILWNRKRPHAKTETGRNLAWDMDVSLWKSIEWRVLNIQNESIRGNQESELPPNTTNLKVILDFPPLILHVQSFSKFCPSLSQTSRTEHLHHPNQHHLHLIYSNRLLIDSYWSCCLYPCS